MKTGPHGKKHRTFQEEEGFYLRQLRRLASAELRRFSPDCVTVNPPDVCCRSSVSLKKSAEGSQHVQSCLQCDSRTFEVEESGFLGAPWPVWTLNLDSVSNVQAVGKLGMMKSRTSVNNSEVMGETVFRKSGFAFVVPSVVEPNVKRKPEMDLGEVPKTNNMCVTWRLIWPK